MSPVAASARRGKDLDAMPACLALARCINLILPGSMNSGEAKRADASHSTVARVVQALLSSGRPLRVETSWAGCLNPSRSDCATAIVGTDDLSGRSQTDLGRRASSA